MFRGLEITESPSSSSAGEDSGLDDVAHDQCLLTLPSSGNRVALRGKEQQASLLQNMDAANSSRSVSDKLVNVPSQKTVIQISSESPTDAIRSVTPSRLVVRSPNRAFRKETVSAETIGACTKQSAVPTSPIGVCMKQNADTASPITKDAAIGAHVKQRADPISPHKKIAALGIPKTADNEQLAAKQQESFAFDQMHRSSKQLIYLKIKAQTYSRDFLVFKGDSLTLQQELLILANTGVFTAHSLQFALSRHSKMNGLKLKGNYFTAGFTPSVDVNIPDLILEAQAGQKNSCFAFQLTAITANGPKPTKAKVTFARQLESLADIFQLEFQVKIPLVITETPAKDFALLVSEILFPPLSALENPPKNKDNIVNEATFVQRSELLTEIERIESFCLPLKHTHTEHGLIVNKLLTGFFPLNLEDDEHRDVAICQRLIFAALYGLDLRPRHRERYIFILPVLADKQQLERTPANFKKFAASLQEAFQQSGIPRISSKPTQSLSSTSESEAEDLYLARYQNRAQALRLLPSVACFL
jgi:hypothetical protein